MTFLWLGFVCYGYSDHRDLTVLTHSSPTRRSSDLTVMWARRQDGRQALPCQATTLPNAALAGWRKNKIAEGVRILTVRAKFMAAARVLAAVIRARILTTIR